MTCTSFFIPRRATRFTESQVHEVFYRFYIGRVNRVDFVPIVGETRFQSAFVHMEYVNDVHATNVIMDRVFNQNKGYKIYPDYINQNAYWILLKNKNPVSDTRLNIHQIVENANILQDLVTKQGMQIARLQDVIYQMSGKLYDQRTEMNKIYKLNNYMVHSRLYDKGWLNKDGYPESE
jgi:hypothetical protein